MKHIREYHQEVMLYVLPDFNLTEFSAVVDVLQTANRVSGQSLYRWNVMSSMSGPINSTAGVSVEAADFSETSISPDIMVFIGGESCQQNADLLKTAAHWLRCRKAQVIILSNAVMSLIQSGFFQDTTVSAHWEYKMWIDTIQGRTKVDDRLFCQNGRILTSAGRIAAFDVLLQVLSDHHGQELASQVAEVLVKGSIRCSETSQRRHLRDRVGTSNRHVLHAIEIMEESCEWPPKICEIAADLNIGSRQLERLFHKYFKQTPIQYFKEIRLLRAKRLLEQTSMTLIEISVACGFKTTSNFSKEFKRYFSDTPSKMRKNDYGLASVGSHFGCNSRY